MTKKTITLTNKKQITEIKVGTILKFNKDLFIVAKLEENILETPTYNNIDDALFGARIAHTHTIKERLYNLISLSTGTRYFDKNMTMSELLHKINNTNSRYSSNCSRFEIVEEIEFKEIH
jgi:hypothetical protein